MKFPVLQSEKLHCQKSNPKESVRKVAAKIVHGSARKTENLILARDPRTFKSTL